MHPASHLDAVNLPSHLVAYQAPTTTTTTRRATTTTTTAPPTDDDDHAAAADDHDDDATATAATDHDDDGTARAAATANSEVGEATWYAAAPDGYVRQPDAARSGRCSPSSTTRPAPRRVCTVDDREAAGYPRVVDLSPDGLLADRRPQPGSGGRHNLLVTLSGADIAQLLSAHGLTPSRALGQNFVADPNTVRRIARLAGRRARRRRCSRSGPAWAR